MKRKGRNTVGEGIPHGTSITGMHREAGRFQEVHRPLGHISLAICDLSPPWPPVIPTCLPPSQMFEAGGGGCGVWPGPMGGSSVWWRKSLPPRPPGSPLEMELGERCTNRKPLWGRVEGRADSSGPAGSAGNGHGHFPWTLGATALSSSGMLWSPAFRHGPGQAVIAQ